MFIIRRAKPDDSPTLLKLAKMVHFTNLPADREIIDEKIAWSRQCFMLAAESETHQPRRAREASAAAAKASRHAHNGAIATGLRTLTGRSPLFMFALEERSPDAPDAPGNLIGTSQVISKMGGPGQPNVSLKLERKVLFSRSLQLGVTHTTAQIDLDESGPTEIGGLILQPSYRGHRAKLGRFLSMVRFHFIGLHRELFSDRVIAEMMGPISVDGRNAFWDHCARAFINMTYEEADRFCQETKEFILTLYPREPIYLTLLPAQARAAVGQVGPETVPARLMLERLGFACHDRVDPFDGGPHLECATDQISLVAATDCAKLGAAAADARGLKEHGIVSVMSEQGDFTAVETPYGLDRQRRLVVPAAAMAALGASAGAEAGYTPMSPARPIGGKPAADNAEPAPNKPKRRSAAK